MFFKKRPMFFSKQRYVFEKGIGRAFWEIESSLFLKSLKLGKIKIGGEIIFSTLYRCGKS